MSVNSQSHTESAALTGAGAATRGNDYNIGASNVYGNFNLQDQSGQHITNIYGTRTDDLHSLKGSVSPEAEFDSSVQDLDRQCHRGTREGVLTTLRNWTDNPNSKERICWLFGPAGAGKSAIAQTIARSYDRPKIAATFFFFKSDAKRNDGNRLFPTLAYQLAFSIPSIRARIAKSLSERPGLPNAGIETQFKELIARPFHAVRVLREGAPQQLSQAGDVNLDILNQYQELAPVVIIDGIDECTDENLQRQFLKVIGDAVTDPHFPLRFLLVSRPEAHIEQIIYRFQKPILSIDLAKLEDANRDIEKYLVDELSRIASERDLDSTWPGKKIIDDIVYKSSGNFIFASLVIRFVGDPYAYPPTQLDIVFNIQLSETASPLAPLDQLYLEILKRVPKQDFLKRYLALFTARISVQNGSGLHEDDAMIMHVSQKELNANLSRMRSILKFDGKKGIDLHHKSFLDFLYDVSRSDLYHIPQPSGGRRFVELYIDSLIRYMTIQTEQSRHHPYYFSLAFESMIRYAPPKFTLPTNEWWDVILPLLDFQDKLLQLPDLTSDITKSSAFRISRDLLLVGLYHGIFDEGKNSHSVVVQSVNGVRKREGIVSSTKTKVEKENITEKLNDLLSSISRLPEAIRIRSFNESVINGDKLDAFLLLLFCQLPETIEGWSPTNRIINLTKKILCFNHVETATRVRFISDAQKLMDLLDYLINEKDVVGIDQETMHQATLLALNIFYRAQVLPISSLSKEKTSRCRNYSRLSWVDENKVDSVCLRDFFHTFFTNRILDRRYVAPVVVDREISISKLFGFERWETSHPLIVEEWLSMSNSNSTRIQEERTPLLIEKWRSMSNPNSTKIQVIFRIAKIIQYFYSMGVKLEYNFGTKHVYLDENFQPKISCLRSLRYLHSLVSSGAHDGDMSHFGYTIYEVFTGINTSPKEARNTPREIISRRPSAPEIPENVWKLIQMCVEFEGPNINQIVKEIESWGIEMESPETAEHIQERRVWKIRMGTSALGLLISIAVVLFTIGVM